MSEQCNCTWSRTFPHRRAKCTWGGGTKPKPAPTKAPAAPPPVVAPAAIVVPPPAPPANVATTREVTALPPPRPADPQCDCIFASTFPHRKSRCQAKVIAASTAVATAAVVGAAAVALAITYDESSEDEEDSASEYEDEDEDDEQIPVVVAVPVIEPVPNKKVSDKKVETVEVAEAIASPPTKQNPKKKKQPTVHVKGFNNQTSREDLQNYFATTFGPVKKVKIYKTLYSFVTFDDAKFAEQAWKMGTMTMPDGQELKVSKRRYHKKKRNNNKKAAQPQVDNKSSSVILKQAQKI